MRNETLIPKWLGIQGKVNVIRRCWNKNSYVCVFQVMQIRFILLLNYLYKYRRTKKTMNNKHDTHRSIPSGVFLGKGVIKISGKYENMKVFGSIYLVWTKNEVWSLKLEVWILLKACIFINHIPTFYERYSLCFLNDICHELISFHEKWVVIHLWLLSLRLVGEETLKYR